MLPRPPTLLTPQVRTRLDGLRRKLENDIDAALDPSGGGMGLGRGGVACPAAPSRGRWPTIWSKAKRLFLGAGGADSAEDMQLRLAKLHSEIYQQVL